MHLNKHDGYLDHLSNRLETKYDYVLKNIPIYSKRKRLVAEIDLLAYKDGYYDVYEVKCSHRIAKAKKQLKKIKKILPNKVRQTFFFCGESGLILPI